MLRDKVKTLIEKKKTHAQTHPKIHIHTYTPTHAHHKHANTVPQKLAIGIVFVFLTRNKETTNISATTRLCLITRVEDAPKKKLKKFKKKMP